MMIDIGVITEKKIKPITIGEIKLPKKIPNLNQSLFKGVNNWEFNNPKIKKIKEIKKNQTTILPSLNNGIIEMIKKM